MDSIGIAARAIKSVDSALVIAGGVGACRARRSQGKAESAFSRSAKVEDTTLGWRFVNPLMKAKYGVDSMPETAENVAVEFKISRSDQDAFALRSQQRTAAAVAAGRLAEEIVPVMVAQKKGDPVIVARDEHPRETTLEALARLKGVVKPDGSVTAGNASGVNDGSLRGAARSAEAVKKYRLDAARAGDRFGDGGVPPRIMGFGRPPRCASCSPRPVLKLADIDVIELNEAFASQALAVLRDQGIRRRAERQSETAARSRWPSAGASGGRVL